MNTGEHEPKLTSKVGESVSSDHLPSGFGPWKEEDGWECDKDESYGAEEERRNSVEPDLHDNEVDAPDDDNEECESEVGWGHGLSLI